MVAIVVDSTIYNAIGYAEGALQVIENISKSPAKNKLGLQLQMQQIAQNAEKARKSLRSA